MNKRKVLGLIVTFFGLIMVGGAAQSGYGLVAPLSMSLIVLAGLAMMFWDKVSTWMGSDQSQKPPMQ
ncbi:MAG: hypothetical protein HZB99_02290 [Candidatus Harrisonbacteria bacterium]|nr:hypothetical protein [Candidatus Harrisonbacteria bacterium]